MTSVFLRICLVVGLSLGASAASNQAAAPPNPVSSEPLENAVELLLERMEERTDLGLPRMGDPDLKRLHQEVNAYGKTLASRKATIDVPRLSELCGRVNYINNMYLLHGGAEALPAAQLQARNAEKYFDEIYPVILFGLYCTSAPVAQLEAFMAGLSPDRMTSARLDGAKMVRNGLAGQVKGLIMIAADAKLDSARRQEVLSALAAQADLVGRALDRTQKTEVLEMLAEAAKAASLDQDLVRKIASGIEASHCARLCPETP